jgi:hypothetical protein
MNHRADGGSSREFTGEDAKHYAADPKAAQELVSVGEKRECIDSPASGG